MRPVQLRRPCRGSDFVLPDVPMLESPEWSDEDIAPFFSRVSPASRQPAHPHHRHAHAGAMAMHPGYHRGSPGMMGPLAPAQYGSPFRVQHAAAPFSGFNHPGRGDYALPPPPFGDRARQTANAACRTPNTTHHRARGNFQRGAESDGGDEDADDEHDEAGTRAETSHGAGLTALLDRVAEEDTGAGGGDEVPVSPCGGSFGAGRMQSRFQFQRGSLFAPSAQQFMNGMGRYGDARDAGSDDSDNADVSSSTTSGSNSSDTPSGTQPPNRRASMAQCFPGPATGGAWVDEGPALAPLPRRPSARGASVASAFLNERQHQHPSIFMANAGGRGGAATLGTASAAPSIFCNFFDDDGDEDDANSFGCGVGGAAAASNLSTSRSRTTGGAAPSMMVSSAAHNGTAVGAAAGAAGGRHARSNAAPTTAAAAATRLPEVSAQGHYSYMHSTTAPTNPAVSNTAPATITDSNSADPTNPTIGADPKLGALFGKLRQGSFLMAMDEVPADVRAQHAATTHLLPHDANTHGRRDSQPRPTQSGERGSPPQLSHGFQADRWTGAKQGGLGAALAEYALLSKRVAGESSAASAISTRSAHSSRTAEGPPSHHQTSEDAPDSDEEAAVLERRSRFFEVSTSHRHGARDEEGGQQHNGVYPNTLFARGAPGVGGGQHKTQSPAAPPAIKSQPDRVNFRNRIAPRGHSAGGGGGGVGGSGGSVAGAQGLPPRRPATMTDSTAFSVEMHSATGTVTAMSSAASTPHDAVMTAPVTEVDEYGLLAWTAGSPIRTRFGSTVSYGGFSDLAGGNTPAPSPALPGAPAAARGAGVVPLSLQPLSMATAGGGRFSRRTSSNASPHTVVTILDDAGSPMPALPSTRRISPSGAARPRPHDGGQRTLPPPQLTDVALPASASTALPATGVTSAQTTPAAPAVATASESPATSAPSLMMPSPRPQRTLSLYHQDEFYPINSFRGNSVDRLTSGAASPYWVSNASAAATGATTRMAGPAARRGHDDELDPLAQPRQSLCALSPDRLRVAEDDQRRLSRSNPTLGASPAPQRAPSSLRVKAMSPVVFVSTTGAAGPQDVPFASTPKAGGGSTVLAMDGEYQFFTRDTDISSSGVGEGYMMVADTHAIVSPRAIMSKLSTTNARASPRSAVPGEVEQRASAQVSASGDYVTSIVSAVEVELPHKPRKEAQHERRRGSPRERGLPLRPATPPKAQPAPRPWDSCSGLTPTTSGAGLSGPESVPQNARVMEHVVVASTATRQRSPRASSRPSRRLKVLAKRMTM